MDFMKKQVNKVQDKVGNIEIGKKMQNIGENLSIRKSYLRLVTVQPTSLFIQQYAFVQVYVEISCGNTLSYQTKKHMLSRNQEMPSEIKEISFEEEFVDQMIKFKYLPIRDRFAEKKIHFKVLATNGKTTDTLSERTVDLTHFFQKGQVRETVRMDGKVKSFVVDLMVETPEEATSRTGDRMSQRFVEPESSDDEDQPPVQKQLTIPRRETTYQSNPQQRLEEEERKQQEEIERQEEKEREKREWAEKEKLRKEQEAANKEEQDRLDKEREEREKVEREKQEKEKQEKQKLAKEKLRLELVNTLEGLEERNDILKKQMASLSARLIGTHLIQHSQEDLDFLRSEILESQRKEEQMLGDNEALRREVERMRAEIQSLFNYSKF